MSSDLAIQARGVTKRYRIQTDTSEEESTSHRWRKSREWFTALDSVDLDIARGEVVGLIGRNGSGKSTLLKVLSRITAPSEGEIDVWGRVGSLLEVGTGFHPELTGRENVFLNGAILGMRRPDIARQFDDIVEFADIGPFLDTPVKRYSSGMHVRLAFAVAAHLNPDILVIDEVLSVGDAEFQLRCLAKIREVATEEGRTVLFVSHNMASVEHLCSRAVVLAHGQVKYIGDAAEAIGLYLATATHAGANEAPGIFAADGRHVTRITVTDGERVVDRLLTGQPLTILLDVNSLAELKSPMVGIRVRTPTDQTVFSATTRMKPLGFVDPTADSHQIALHIPSLPLVSGRYWLDVDVKEMADGSVRDRLEHVAELDVVGATDVYRTGFEPRPTDGVVYVWHEWSVTPHER